MAISISNLIAYTLIGISITVGPIALMLLILGARNSSNKSSEQDKELFKQPPAKDCPICFLRMPTFRTGSKYKPCCGKIICSGCMHAPVYDHRGNKVSEKKCPFCRVVAPKTDDEINDRLIKRVEANDAIALYNTGNYYRDGRNGFPQDHEKALELWHRAGELGHSKAYNSIGIAYSKGRGVEVDLKKVHHYYELAAMKGDARARHNLGHAEGRNGNMNRALKHYMIAISSGYSESLEMIQKMYSNGYATKEEYMKALQLYQTYLGEIKSDQRDKAAAFDEKYRYH